MKKLLIYILIFLICFFSSYFGYRKIFEKKRKNPKYNVLTMIQTGSEKEALKSQYLQEILNLSIDKPTNYYSFEAKDLETKLLSSPHIKKAFAKKIKPNSIYVDYKINKPKAYLADFENVAIDEKGNVFPVFPFLSQKKMPKIYLGNNFDFLSENFWNEKILGKKINLAFEILKLINFQNSSKFFDVEKIDVSKIDSESFGKREIVLKIFEKIYIDNKECIFPKILRLNSREYSKQLGNYLVLREKILSDYKNQLNLSNEKQKIITFSQKVIDFRIPNMAFIDEN